MLNEKRLESELREILENDSDLLESCVKEINWYDGTFSDDEWFDMEELEEYLDSKSPIDILNMGFYGEDEDGSESFNPNRDYFKFNAYGNLVSTNYPDYSDLIDDVIEKIKAYYDDTIDFPEEIMEVIENNTYDYEWELENESDMEILMPEIESYDIMIEDDTIYCKEDNVGDIEDIIVSMEIEYC